MLFNNTEVLLRAQNFDSLFVKHMFVIVHEASVC